MNIKVKYLPVANMNESQKLDYVKGIDASYPEFILSSKIIKNYWERLETYFPDYQIGMIDSDSNLIGFINSIPLYWDQPVTELPDEGWDWLMVKGIEDYENGKAPNCLGAIQIIILKKHQGKGYSKVMLAKGKELMKDSNFEQFVLPIRPTFKWKHPEMKMKDYLNVAHNGEIFDPWIRTHLKSGAEIIKVCSKSMQVSGDIPFWEKMLGMKISSSHKRTVEGALSPIDINLERNFGEYHEENIWIRYR